MANRLIYDFIYIIQLSKCAINLELLVYFLIFTGRAKVNICEDEEFLATCDLVRKHVMSTDSLCLVFIPALIVVLREAEDKKGSPLTESEVYDIRDQAVCIILPLSTAESMDKERGYPDIVAEDCWNEWQQLRLST